MPGALSNQPPGAATAPLTAPAAQAQRQAPGQQPPGQQPPTNTHRENIVNYEVDKTIRHTKAEVGAIKRLSAAVVVNYRRASDAGGKVTYTPLTEQELAQINTLAREAMGFSQERGDTLNVVNAPFSAEAAALRGVEAAGRMDCGGAPAGRSPAGVGSLVMYAGAVLALLIALLLVRSAVRDLTRAGQRPGARRADRAAARRRSRIQCGAGAGLRRRSAGRQGSGPAGAADRRQRREGLGGAVR